MRMPWLWGAWPGLLLGVLAICNSLPGEALATGAEDLPPLTKHMKNVCEYQRVELLLSDQETDATALKHADHCPDNDTDCIAAAQNRTEATSTVHLQNKTVTVFACCPGWARANGSLELHNDTVGKEDDLQQASKAASNEGCTEQANSETRYNDYGDLVSWGDIDYYDDFSEENLELNDGDVEKNTDDKIESDSNEDIFDIYEYVSDSADIKNMIHPKHKPKDISFSKPTFEKILNEDGDMSSNNKKSTKNKNPKHRSKNPRRRHNTHHSHHKANRKHDMFLEEHAADAEALKRSSRKISKGTTGYDAYSITVIRDGKKDKKGSHGSDNSSSAHNHRRRPSRYQEQVARPEETVTRDTAIYAVCGRKFCYNGGRCVYGRCICSAGFFGARCQYDRNECALNNGGCDHECKNTVGSFKCCCRSGFALDHDQRSCIDVDECSDHNGGCSDLCLNTNGSYQCRCPSGRRLLPDGRTCS
ncbi:unnamed protein product, partial [Meganyctiphanes norvegica]